jgi:hypothetical protein
MTDPRYPGWDHPITLADSEDHPDDVSEWFGPDRRRPAPALVLALVVGGLVVVGIVVAWVRG